MTLVPASTIAPGSGSWPLTTSPEPPIGSTSALLGDLVPQDAYTASKGAVVSLTRSLAVQFGPHGIRANCIHPGFVDTPMQTERTSDPAWVAEAVSTIPLGRLGRPRDVVAAALFLASDEAAYVTGAELVVDGGSLVTELGDPKGVLAIAEPKREWFRVTHRLGLSAPPSSVRLKGAPIEIRPLTLVSFEAGGQLLGWGASPPTGVTSGPTRPAPTEDSRVQA